MLLISFKSHAGIFGPSNYDECVLDKMKGQDKFMIHTARAACDKLFPEKPIEKILQGVAYEWLSAKDNEYTLVIKEGQNYYSITAVDAIFFEKSCEEKQDESGYEVKGKKTLLSSTKYYFIVPSNKVYKCGIVTFTGFEK